MISHTLLALSLIASSSKETIELIPSDDVWVYPHSSDNKDAYLRVWGVDGVAVADNADAAQSLAYSYLRFELPPTLASKKVVEATLRLKHVADPSWDTAGSKSGPIEVRALVGTFDEKTWDYGLLTKVHPDKTKIYGVASADADKGKGKAFEIDVPLMNGKSVFAGDLASNSSGQLYLALTSKIDPSEGGQRAVYKFYSKDAEKPLRPVLELTVVPK